MPTEAERTRALTQSIADLAANVATLAERVDVLHDSVDADKATVEEQNQRNARKIWWTIATAGLAVFLSGLMLIGYIRQVATSDRLATLIEQQAQTTGRLEKIIAQQELIRSQVLCPLYKLFLGSYQPETRTPGPDRDKYEKAFVEMRGQYMALQCVGDLVPPRNDLVTKPPK